MSIPRWLAVARSQLGTAEIVGPKHNPTILNWLQRLRAWWKDDETPWCGVFVAYCMDEVGLKFPKYYMRAKDWLPWGVGLHPDRLVPGAVLVFQRAGGGHVGFYVGEDDTHYYVLGGNQSNAVNVAKLAKARFLGARWPLGQPVVGNPVRMTAGGAVSKNEA